ncbi:MAG TPA: hypothetical protein VIN58_02200 [Roseateles sp.]
MGGVLGALALLAALSPWLLYELGLSRFDAMPARPAQLVTAEQQAWVWALARGTGEPKIEPMNPYEYVILFFTHDVLAPHPRELMTAWVASDHNLKQPRTGMGWWHLSDAALTIWLTRHWTTEEIASAAYAIAAKWPTRKPRPVSPAS